MTYQNFRNHLKDLSAIEKYYRPTRGKYALAWFDHGPQPAAAACAYTVVIRTTPQELADLAATPAHRVRRFDEKAHIVHDLASDTTGYVLFEAADGLADGPLRACDRPAFLLSRREGGVLHCSMACTMEKNADPFPATPIRLVIAGGWLVTAGEVKAEPAGADTAVTVVPRDNTPLRWTLRAR